MIEGSPFIWKNIARHIEMRRRKANFERERIFLVVGLFILTFLFLATLVLF